MRNQNGVSLVELTIVVLTVGFLVFLLSNLPSAIGLVGKSRHQSIAREIITKQIEDKRATQYANLAQGTENITDFRLSQLPGGSGTILIEACDIAVCTQGEDAVQLTVNVSWKEGPNPQSVTIKTLIAEGGLNQ